MEDLLTEKIYVSEDSKKLIQINYRIYVAIAVIFFITSVLSLFVHTLRYFKHADKVYKNWFNIFNLQWYPVIAIIQTILGCFQVFYFFNAVKCQQRAMVESDQSLFDKSFTFLTKGNKIAIIVMSIHFLYDLVFFYQETSA